MLEQWICSGLNLWILVGLVIALFGIGLQLQRLNNAEVLCIIAPCHDSATLKSFHVLRTGGDIHLKTAALVELNVP